jgi:hypothetical protein
LILICCARVGDREIPRRGLRLCTETPCRRTKTLSQIPLQASCRCNCLPPGSSKQHYRNFSGSETLALQLQVLAHFLKNSVGLNGQEYRAGRLLSCADSSQPVGLWSGSSQPQLPSTIQLTRYFFMDSMSRSSLPNCTPQQLQKSKDGVSESAPHGGTSYRIPHTRQKYSV